MQYKMQIRVECPDFMFSLFSISIIMEKSAVHRIKLIRLNISSVKSEAFIQSEISIKHTQNSKSENVSVR